jgi:hypothetical protein
MQCRGRKKNASKEANYNTTQIMAKKYPKVKV